ncbi:hypothetical protein H6F51_01320 [Cyanobacteria bacterium FACHB-DQ100]|uniref:DUF6658 family protein n=1 Tax=unclassified Leptolyngbya TaxID=2650499 RepID=UPI00168167C7|nr:DUF6658 family protein [Leptolyngbya sp. FACHB-17]MBD1821161.1 hypothetical protein [Cyanobacteria bacterium FACHB-DQ100]MBD2082733.1 hypothetical protein [Leptolyngbya sp. FACHB-17]
MKKIASFIKATRLKQIAIVFFAGVMLLLNTACSNAAQAKTPKAQMDDGGSHPVGQTQPYEGGMNNFSDTPPGQIPTDKAKSLVDNAKRNITSNDPTKAEPRNAELYKNPGYAAERTKDTLGNAVNSRANNAKEEAKKVGDRISASGERAVEKTKELGERIQQGAGNVSDNVGNSVAGAGEDTKFKAKEARKSLNDAVKDAID